MTCEVIARAPRLADHGVEPQRGGRARRRLPDRLRHRGLVRHGPSVPV